MRARALLGSAAATWLLGAVIAAGAGTPAFAQVCAASGKDGPATIGGIVNTYYPATAGAAAGATTINVGAATGGGPALAAGDLVLVIQMQDGVNVANFPNNLGTYTTTANTAGTHEYKLVAGFNGTVVTLHTALVNRFTAICRSNIDRIACVARGAAFRQRMRLCAASIE